MSEEGFFERLREKAWSQLRGTRNDLFHPAVKEFVSEGISATIEALKEKRIGRRKRARISHHTKPDGEQWTLVRCVDAEAITLDGHHGTDGEEVVVLVVRL